jgi:large subunit ribosomal protein L21e
MAKRSKGTRSRTRYKYRRPLRSRGLSPISRSLQQFNVGEKANIVVDPSIHKGQPHARYHGLTGTIIGTQGRAYQVEVTAGRTQKVVIVLPEHLRKVK